MTVIGNFLIRMLVSFFVAVAIFALAFFFAQQNQLAELYEYETLMHVHPVWAMLVDMRNEVFSFGVVWLTGVVIFTTMGLDMKFVGPYLNLVLANVLLLALFMLALICGITLVEVGGGFIWPIPLAMLSVAAFVNTPDIFKREDLAYGH